MPRPKQGGGKSGGGLLNTILKAYLGEKVGGEGAIEPNEGFLKPGEEGPIPEGGNVPFKPSAKGKNYFGQSDVAASKANQEYLSSLLKGQAGTVEAKSLLDYAGAANLAKEKSLLDYTRENVLKQKAGEAGLASTLADAATQKKIEDIAYYMANKQPQLDPTGKPRPFGDAAYTSAARNLLSATGVTGDQATEQENINRLESARASNPLIRPLIQAAAVKPLGEAGVYSNNPDLIEQGIRSPLETAAANRRYIDIHGKSVDRSSRFQPLGPGLHLDSETGEILTSTKEQEGGYDIENKRQLPHVPPRLSIGGKLVANRPTTDADALAAMGAVRQGNEAPLYSTPPDERPEIEDQPVVKSIRAKQPMSPIYDILGDVGGQLLNYLNPNTGDQLMQEELMRRKLEEQLKKKGKK